MCSMLIAEQKIEGNTSQDTNYQEDLELMELSKKEFLASSPPWIQKKLREMPFKAPPGLEDQFNAWPPVEGKYVFKLPDDIKNDEDTKIEEDVEDDTTCAGSGSDREEDTTSAGSDRDGDSSEDESPSKLSTDAPEFFFGQLSADAPVFNPTSQLSASAQAFNPSPLRTSAQSFVPGFTRTKLTAGAKLFVPLCATTIAAPNEAAPVMKTKTKLAVVTKKSELFVPAWPELNASVEMKTKKKK